MRPACVVLVAILSFACRATPDDVSAPEPEVQRTASARERTDFARQTFARPLSVDDAQQILERTEVFAFGGVDDWPQPEAYRTLLKQRDALDRARRLAAVARPAGQLYAYCMLKALSSPEADPLAFSLAQRSQRIRMWAADTVTMPTVSSAYVRISLMELWRTLGAEPAGPPRACRTRFRIHRPFRT